MLYTHFRTFMNNSIFKRAAMALAVFLSINVAPGVTHAQRLISYQGIATDANNLPVTGDHSITVSIYTSDTGGIPVYQEEQKVTLNSQGLFNLLIGKVKPLGALSVANPETDRYYLGVQIDQSSELAPRSSFSDVLTAFFADTAGYAKNAHFADTADFARAIDPAGLNIVPTTVNGISPAVTIVGGGNTTVNTSGNTISISSTEASAIQDLINIDGSLTILAPNGPTTSITVTDSGITTLKLAGGAVTNAKLASGAVSNANLLSGAVTNDKVASGASSLGLVLTADGTGGTLWQSATATAISLPYVGSVAANTSVFSLTNTGTGGAGSFQVTNAANTTAAVQATTNGTGSAGAFSITNAANSTSALSTTTNGFRPRPKRHNDGNRKRRHFCNH